MEWKTIDSAPKDGSIFQAWVEQATPPACDWMDKGGWWEAECRYGEDEAFQVYGRIDYDMDDWETRYDLKPTHWMPLPEPPK